VASTRGEWHELDREGKVGFGKVEREQVVLRYVTDTQGSWRGHREGSFIQVGKKTTLYETERKHEVPEVIWSRCDAIGEVGEEPREPLT